MDNTIRAAEIARLLNVCQKTVYNLANRGKIPPYWRVGRNCYWDKARVENFIASLKD